MPYNFNTLIGVVDTKAQALAASATPKDLVFIGKAIEAMNPSTAVSAVLTQGDTSVAAVVTQQGTSLTAITAAKNAAVTALNALAYPTPTTTAVNKTILNNEFVLVTASGKTISLPAGSAGASVVYIAVGDFLDTVVAPNGSQKIMGLAESLTLDRKNTVITLQYHSDAAGWRVY
jgi:hypothetical protein